MAKLKILMKALGIVMLYIFVGFILPLLFIKNLPDSIYVVAIVILGFLIYRIVWWMKDRRAERQLYGKNFITPIESIQNKFRIGLIVLFWFCLLFGLGFVAYAFLQWVFPHAKWIHGTDENGDYFDRRLTIATCLGIATTFWIAHKMKKL